MTTLEIFGVIGIVLIAILVLIIIGFIFEYFLNLNYKLEKLERQREATSDDIDALLKIIRELEQEVYSNENSN